MSPLQGATESGGHINLLLIVEQIWWGVIISSCIMSSIEVAFATVVPHDNVSYVLLLLLVDICLPSH